jgi:phosphoglycolate phosphatase-like HAD superfamily hydrolase
VPREPLLVLFDVDGTLLLTDDPLMGRAVVETLGDVYGVDLPADAIGRVDHPGQSNKRIGRLVLRAAGLDDAAIDPSLDRWCELSAQRYLELLAAVEAPGWQLRPGSFKALEALERDGMRLALLTGNPEPVARARMERLGLARFFPPGQGGFGCDAEERAALIETARRRAGGWPAGRTVAVGDTPRDGEAAREAGIRSILFGPDVEDMAGVVAALRPLA